MPTKGLRYMNKVDLEKEAATDPILHVRASQLTRADTYGY
jgi:hypothetical protein